jgi:predicted nucleotidyltransferase
MPSFEDITQILREQQPVLRQRFGVTILGVFGSYIRGEQTDESDVDVLIDLNTDSSLSLIDLIELEYALGDLIGRKADVVIRDTLRKRIGRRILEEVVPV